MKRVVVWGSGNVGRPAIRAVLAHRDLELAGVIVSSDDKCGRDVGELVGLPPTGVSASRDWRGVLASGDVDAVVYAATADTRPQAAYGELLACLQAGVNVVSASFYPLLYPATAPDALRELVDAACARGRSSLFISGVDPGWAMDILPILLSGVVADIREVRAREIFDYSLYDAPAVVRDVIGFGGSMEELPVMLQDQSLQTVWGPMVRLMGDALDSPVDTVQTRVERRPLQWSVDVGGMGRFEAGTQGAFRFEVIGLCAGQPRFVVEHITRIHPDVAPDWPVPAEGGGCHQVLISGSPDLSVSLHAHDAREHGAAAGGNATAANRLVNAIPAVCDAAPGVLTPLDLPAINGAAQLRRGVP